MLCNILSGQLWTAKCFSFLISCLVSFYIMTMIIVHTKVFLSHCHNFILQNLCLCIIYKKIMILRGCTYFKLQWSYLKSLHFVPDDFHSLCSPGDTNVGHSFTKTEPHHVRFLWCHKEIEGMLAITPTYTLLHRPQEIFSGYILTYINHLQTLTFTTWKEYLKNVQ